MKIVPQLESVEALFPVKYPIPKEEIALAEAYKDAGMTAKSDKLYQALYVRAIIEVCEKNEIPILEAGWRWEKCGGVNLNLKGRGDCRDYSWTIIRISGDLTDVPMKILHQMKNLSEDHRARLCIAERDRDPLLLYLLPFFVPQNKFIELAQWE